MAFGRVSSSSHARHRRPSTSRPWRPSSRRGWRSRSGSPMTNRTSTGSIVPEIQTPAIPTGLTKALHGSHPKSRSVTVTPWFLKIPDSAHRGAQNPLPKTILARWTGRLGSVPMIFPPNAPNPATSRPSAEHSSFQGFSFQRFSFSRSPLSPRNPHFPALRSAPTAVSGASRQKQIPSSSPCKPLACDN